jgi:hypothetical protein
MQAFGRGSGGRGLVSQPPALWAFLALSAIFWIGAATASEFSLHVAWWSVAIYVGLLFLLLWDSRVARWLLCLQSAALGLALCLPKNGSVEWLAWVLVLVAFGQVALLMLLEMRASQR